MTPRHQRGGAVGSALLFGALVAASAPAETPPRLAASELQPGVGQSVRLWLSYSGPWPVDARWTGVDEADGAEARVVARSPGPLSIEVSVPGRPPARVRLDVQPAANRGPLPPPTVTVRALSGVSLPCGDPRYPKLAGLWAVGCSGAGVDRAEHLLDHSRFALTGPALSPGVAEGRLYAPTRDHGLWVLPEPAPDHDVHHMPDAGLAPPGFDGQRAAVSTEGQVEVFALSENTRQRYIADPAPWYPPALAGPWVAWVDLRDRALTGEDLWLLAPGAREAEPWVRAPGDQRHVAGGGDRWMGWIDDDAVTIEDLERRERRRHPTDAHTSRGLTMWGPVACWEVWDDGDIDLACSDGLRVDRPGHQRSPSRYGPWLLFQEGAQTLLAAADALVLDDDDPRATALGPRVPAPEALRGARVDGGVRYALQLPEGPWTVARHGPEGWGPPEPIEGGAISLVAPWGDAIRLAPAYAL
ncbi:MAG: hypothetical protein H6739_32425 [Alphaproteobacteria bacterium]|nr:hypothetical protein [Alphaproteobacteria bacterium]